VTERLDAERIAEGILPSLRPLLRLVTILPETDSTNSELSRLKPAEQHAHAILAERQTGGRGRRERKWHSPPGGNIYLSFGWRFMNDECPLSTLPLIVAVAVANALSRAGLTGHGIKWPNDILVNGKKLAGILVELKSAGNGGATAVIGIGINVRMPSTEAEDPAKIIDRPWTDLEAHIPAGNKPQDRNLLVSKLLDQLLAALSRFENSGFETFRNAWGKYDLLVDGRIKLEMDNGTICGIARGVNDAGELLLETKTGEVRSFNAGEVSVFREIKAF
jgi:BirA family biotin operon repressor/biotin-[acetyl-CoA-carboxylase] ligase